MIFCSCGTFLENSLSSKTIFLPHMLSVCMSGEWESLSFSHIVKTFQKLARRVHAWSQSSWHLSFCWQWQRNAYGHITAASFQWFFILIVRLCFRDMFLLNIGTLLHSAKQNVTPICTDHFLKAGAQRPYTPSEQWLIFYEESMLQILHNYCASVGELLWSHSDCINSCWKLKEFGECVLHHGKTQ